MSSNGTTVLPPSFNLWTEPWIPLERADGEVERHGIEQTLLQAGTFTGIYHVSPLVVVGIHRLLVAVLQASIHPREPPDLKRVWQARAFPAQAVAEFGKQFAARFDLFSDSAPFLQSADLPLQQQKGQDAKTIAYLMAETPAGTEITHFRHGSADEQAFCPACAAQGLVVIPCFASSGGAGIKPSINGVPPLYVLPGGGTLFESLAASLTLPYYRPGDPPSGYDLAWWARPPLVQRSQEAVEVGYLHSLTFPARRVRLHPELLDMYCTRCGRRSLWGVRTMIFEMGENRPKEAAPWQDPFVAYRLPSPKELKTTPTPIRPQAGKALWREYAALFLPQSQEAEKVNHITRPRVLYQLANEDTGIETSPYPFRCIGLRTDNKAKIFEWIDAEFQVPLSLLDDPDAGDLVQEAIQFATDCARGISRIFRELSSRTKKAERYSSVRQRMEYRYWGALAQPFRQFVLDVATAPERQTLPQQWADDVVNMARESFVQALAEFREDTSTLRLQAIGEDRCTKQLNLLRKEYVSHE
ncbi:MAG: type I-E CRISPR-associated protein Cse1/CasA [Chloroflexi bacterium]|nr:type I-E CRISPR-associated protein Cse1/CasA [Chloroflexota bacterium]